MLTFEHAIADIFSESSETSWIPSSCLLHKLEKNGTDYSSFLRPSRLLHNARLAALPVEWDESLLGTSRLIRENPALSKLHSLFSQLLIHERESYEDSLLELWPDPQQTMGNDSSLFYVLVTLSCIPILLERHKKMNIPQDVTQDTCACIGRKCLDYFFFNGKMGVVKWAIYWFRNYLEGTLFCLGRLEYMIKTFDRNSTLYRNRYGETLLMMRKPLSGESFLIRHDGSPSSKKLPLGASWKEVLKGGDYLLDIHIPGGGKMSMEAIRDSMERALFFFDRHFPEKKTKGFLSISWIFSPDLDAIFDSNSNLIQFRSQVFRFPVETRRVDGHYFLFGTFSKNPADWPENSSVQRRLKKHLMQGGAFRTSGMLYLREDVARLGSITY